MVFVKESVPQVVSEWSWQLLVGYLVFYLSGQSPQANYKIGCLS